MGGRPGVIGAFVMVCAGFTAAAAADPIPSFGVTGDSQYVVTAWDVSPDVSGTTWDFTLNNGYRFATGGSKEFIGAAYLPQGALVQQIGLEACDSSTDGQVGALLIRFDPLGHTILAGVGTGVAETPGCTEVFANLAVPETIDQASYRYLVVVSNDTTDGSNTFGAVHVVYKLQVSPPPGTATFNDVPTTDPAFQFIEALVASGITAGCGGGNYCPDAPLTRRQMAIFLSKALGLYWPDGLVN
jgi:S-layer homology domain